MARQRRNALPKYLELNPHNHTFYYRHPGMPGKANLGKEERAVDPLPHKRRQRMTVSSSTPSTASRRIGCAG